MTITIGIFTAVGLLLIVAGIALTLVTVVVSYACKARGHSEDARKAALQAELANEAAGQNAARASASEHAAATWARAVRPAASNECEFAEALRKEFERRPIPADAANSDWNRVIPKGGDK